MTNKYFIRKHGRSVSNAEDIVHQALINRGLQPHANYPFELDYEKDGIHGTKIDFYFTNNRLAVFLDGPHHLKLRQSRKDSLINSALERRNIRVLRFGYKPPLRKWRLMEIVEEIQNEAETKIP